MFEARCFGIARGAMGRVYITPTGERQPGIAAAQKLHHAVGLQRRLRRRPSRNQFGFLRSLLDDFQELRRRDTAQTEQTGFDVLEPGHRAHGGGFVVIDIQGQRAATIAQPAVHDSRGKKQLGFPGRLVVPHQETPDVDGIGHVPRGRTRRPSPNRQILLYVCRSSNITDQRKDVAGTAARHAAAGGTQDPETHLRAPLSPRSGNVAVARDYQQPGSVGQRRPEPQNADLVLAASVPRAAANVPPSGLPRDFPRGTGRPAEPATQPAAPRRDTLKPLRATPYGPARLLPGRSGTQRQPVVLLGHAVRTQAVPPGRLLHPPLGHGDLRAADPHHLPENVVFLPHRDG
ncbi:protein UL79 [Mandrillus leucophaeus cytomegalovirus]|uniref:Protein UL79 n=1 Tax=Mandrillus leucophaeus cytomegalovirus TaxID=1654930 RepID=A0A0G2UGN5_9BETA|nr:protein UL79 [Mandrillus leucophaeus cytomegalovirus]AKI29768.1 protein UL79 [Mandrillus leucophaeus cytomegalovirus]